MAPITSDCLKTLRDLVDNRAFKQLPQDKDVPIVLVPGFSGWGAPILGSLNYWGGIKDVPNLLLSKGYTVIVSSIAPLSSNWERSCELYQQLTCGKFILPNDDEDAVRSKYDLEVDYGDYFSGGPSQGPLKTKTTGRKRAILFTSDSTKHNWTWSRDNKAHFICHSQGGTTVRLLISLMAHGDDRQKAYFGKKRGRDDWAISVITIGTPHKGTTITDVITKLFSASPAVRDQGLVLLARLFATLAYKAPGLQVYDLQLDHWGIGRQRTESFQEMRTRLEGADSPVRRWALYRHNAFYDNSIKGVSELWPDTKKPSTHIYYFTLSFHATIPFPSEYPAWGRLATETFPASILQFAHAILRHIPVLGWVANEILSKLVGITGWAIFSSVVKLRPLVSWGTTDVARRLLQSIGYNIILPTPGKYLPRQDVIPFMLPTVYAMGGQDLTGEEKDILGSNRGDWYLNDGIVNTASMSGPVGTEVSDIAGFLSSSNGRGRYWHFGVNDEMDHADEIGVWIARATATKMVQMYEDLAELVSRLSAAPS